MRLPRYARIENISSNSQELERSRGANECYLDRKCISGRKCTCLRLLNLIWAKNQISTPDRGSLRNTNTLSGLILGSDGPKIGQKHAFLVFLCILFLLYKRGRNIFNNPYIRKCTLSEGSSLEVHLGKYFTKGTVW